jgi:cytochrome c oxidase cbb3-type subunit 3
MVENVLSKMGGVGMYGVISILLFFAVFIGVLVWMIRLKKPYLEEMRELPLDDAAGPESNASVTANPENQHD